MDVVHPKLAWIKGRCYRIPSYLTRTEEEWVALAADEVPHLSEAVADVKHTNKECLIISDEACDADCKIEIADNGQYSATIEIPGAIRGIVIGSKGSTRMRLENETKTSIRHPMQGFEGNTIIKGANRAAVAAAFRRMDAMATSARRRHEPTHFISLPLNGSQVVEGFNAFRQEVLDKCAMDRGVCPQIFQKAEKLHLTIGTLVLLTDSEREKAGHVLVNCANKIVMSILDGKPLLVKVKGIEYMNDDPAEVDVLYAKVAPCNGPERKLQILADQLIEEFVSAGLMNFEHSSVKLHATVMNSIFNRSHSKNVSSSRRRESFDARTILKMFSNFNFGDFSIPAIHISQRHSVSKDGYYAATSQLALPVN